MCVCTALQPSKSGPAPGAAAERLVVLVALVAEGEVVHRPLRGGDDAQGAEKRVGDRLRGLDVAGRDGRRRTRVEHRARRDDDVQRLEAAGVERDVGVDERAEDVEDGGRAHRGRRVEVVGALRRRAGEVDRRPRGRPVDANGDGDLRCRRPSRSANSPSPMRSRTRRTASSALSCTWLHVGARRRRGRTRRPCARARRRPRDWPPPARAGRPRFWARSRTGWGPAVSRAASSRLAQAPPSTSWKSSISTPSSSIVRLSRRHRARRDAADVGVVGRARRRRRGGSRAREHRRDDGQVGQVRAAVVGRVEQERVAGAHGAPAMLAGSP